jgi:phosphate transport system permease protein
VAIGPQVLGAGEPVRPARPLVVSRARTARRIVVDRWASRLVVSGGIVIIASILAILFVIAAEVYPLFKAPTAEFLGTRSPAAAAGAPAAGAAAGVDEYREVAYAIGAAGVLELVGLKREQPLAGVPIPGLDGAQVSVVAALAKGRHLIGTSDGRVIPLDMRFDIAFKDGKRQVTPAPTFGNPSVLDPEQKRPLLRLAGADPGGGPLTVAQVGPKTLAVQTVVEKKALVGASRREESLTTVEVPTAGAITALALDGRAEDLFVATSTGEVLHYDVRDRQTARPADKVAVASKPGVAVTALGFLIGDRTLVVGDQAGGVSTWQIVPPPGGGERRLTRIYQFAGHAEPVVSIDASKRDKGFATADASGRVLVHYGTSGHTLLTLQAPEAGLHSIVFTPKADGIVLVSRQGAIGQWQLDNPHPEITLKTVFGKVWYEGYSAPAYVWQSTGGSDDFEAKFSLTPLIYGTLKGTFYALVFAVPMALLAAVYVSEFMHPTVKAYVKPVVEVMAALPSVVLGFLAGLWLAPMVERVVPGLFMLPLVLPVCILAAYFVWRAVPQGVRGRFRTGTEVFLLIPVVIAGLWLAFTLGGLVETLLLGGNYRGWLLSALGLTYDQRNSLVVGVAMGFAVIPIIFTIAEDSLANVPQHLRAGSLALGANRWQTALRIVLPTASPGIFSAIMIGFGRAVGETMIVLMATGNTPVMDWSVFNGFRALSANIAVELPEAPEGGTLFRVLFLAAFLLFCLTFAVNTVAELVRLKLRQKYRYL